MKVMMLAYEAPEDFALRDDKAKYAAYMGEWYAFGDALEKAGLSRGGAALEQPHAATVLAIRDGKRSVEDGPFPDAKEQLGGYFLLETPDLETAAQWAAKCPAAARGRVEVRVIPDYGQGD